MMATKPKVRFKRSIVITFWITIVFLVIVIIEATINYRSVAGIHINLSNQQDNYFLDTLEIKRLLTDNGKDKVQGSIFRQVSIRTLENRVKSNLFVNKCQIARNLNGDIFVEVDLSKPIARFVREEKPDFYTDSTGKIMPVVEKFTARTLLITREKNKNLPDFAKKDKNLLKLLNYIHQNAFLKAQITQIDIDKKGNLMLYMQVGNQVFEFGRCVDVVEKLKKIKIFYQEILPLKGWMAYKKVNIKFKNQIICE
jgi:cell division protein FtsQ